MQWAALAALLGQLGLAESNGSALYFSTCSHGAETWELASSPNNHEHGLVAVRSTLTGGSCLVTGASPLRTGPCNLTDNGQLFHWNATTKNALPKGATGFVRAASGMGCPEKGGAGSEGCCITNNGEAGAAMYGCCPNGPSDCGNQIIRLYADGTLRDNRNPSDCLQHGPAPPPPPPPGPPQSTVPDPFEKLGASYSARCRCNGVLIFASTVGWLQECQITSYTSPRPLHFTRKSCSWKPSHLSVPSTCPIGIRSTRTAHRSHSDADCHFPCL